MFFKEVDTNGFLVISGKNALAVALNHARFSDGSIANDYHLQRRGSRFHFWYLGVLYIILASISNKSSSVFDHFCFQMRLLVVRLISQFLFEVVVCHFRLIEQK